METVVRPWRAEDRCAVLALNAELQDHERALRPSLRPGAAITGAYVAALEARLARLGEDGALLVAEAADGAVLGLATCFVATDELEQEQRLVRIEDLVVTGTARRCGIGRALLAAAEAAALASGRSLLVLDTETDSDGHRLYAACGWTEVGTIPGYALTTDGRPSGATIFYKEIGR